MDDKGLAILRQLMSDVEGAPSPGVMEAELYLIWYEHAQNVAQAALEYLNTTDPDHGPEDDERFELE